MRPDLSTRSTKEAWFFTPQRLLAELPVNGQDFQHQLGRTKLNLTANTLHRGTTTIEVPAQETVTIFEFIRSAENAALHDQLNIILGAGAAVQHTRIHMGHTSTRYRREANVTLHNGATYRQFTLNADGMLNRSETRIVSVGENAHADVRCLSVLTEKSQADTLVHTHFTAPHCTAHIQQRQLVNDNAHAVFQGKFHVDAIAQKTDAYMLCENLLLGSKSQASMKPELEIYADDVKCSHGATTGSLDAEQLFYLQSRGIPTPTAKQLLMQGFALGLLHAAELDDATTTEVNALVLSCLNKLTA